MLTLRLSCLISLLIATSAFALDGVVKTASGTPLAGMTVSATLLPIDDAEDVTATTTSDAEGRFRFTELKPGKYDIAATSPNACGAATFDETSTNVVIVTAATCRTVSGAVTGATGAHVIAGHFHDGAADLYSIPVRDGRYSLMVPTGGVVVVQAIAPGSMSPESRVSATGDVNVTLERRYDAPPPEARRWIAANAIPLKTVQAGNGFADLEPMRKIIGDARIVALGEATHGTREFFQFKHRVLEFLVAKMGFNLFAIEASEPDAIAIDDYVLTGKGDPAIALGNLGFWTWNTEEVLDMIRWMRMWNDDPSHKTKVRFYGFDMQNPAASQRLLRKWLTANLPDALPLLERKELAPLAARLDAYSPHDSAWQTARHFVELLTEDRSARDRSMAQNIEWIMQHEAPGSRMVVWAHNGHVFADPLPFAPDGTMGVNLRKKFGPQMVVIGFAFDHGSFQAVDQKKGLIVHNAAPLDDRSFDHALATSAPPLFVLDLRPSRGATRQWLDSPLPMRSVGAVYDDANPKSYVSRIHPLRGFDAIFFINETTAAKGLKTPRPKPTPAAVNLSLDEGLTGWTLSPQSVDAGYTATAKSEGCVSGGCAVIALTGERNSEGTGVFAQRIDATPFRGKKIRLRAKMKSALTGDQSSARIWLRVDRRGGATGFFDNMANRAPKSLPEWTDLEITGDVAPDAEAIAFGLLMFGDGMAWIDSVTLDVP